MGRVDGEIATGRIRPIEGNKPLNRTFLSFWLVVLAVFFFFTRVFCQVFDNGFALMTRFKVAFHGSFFEFLYFIRAFGKSDVSRAAKRKSS